MIKSLKSYFILCSLVFALSLSSSNIRAEQNIATIDIPRIVETLFKNSSDGRDLEKRKESETKRLLSKKSEIEKLEDSLRANKASADSAEAEDFRQKVRDYQRELADMEEALGKDMGKIQKEILDKIRGAVDEVAKANNLSLVISKSDISPSVVLYASNTADITEEVLAAIR